MTRVNLALAVLALLAIGIVGCGGGTSSAPGSSNAEASSNSSGGGAKGHELTAVATNDEPEGGVIGVLSISKVENLGPTVIDRGHHVVYVFSKDKGSEPSCYEACATRWPPMITETNPIVRDGIDPKKVSTTEREDGTLQVTYDGMPLYGFSGDLNPYEAKGDGVKAFGGSWHVLHPDGEAPQG